MTAILSVSDLHVMNGEPRVLDLKLADALGFERPRAIRQIITRNLDELRRHGEIVATMTNTEGEDEANSPHGVAISPRRRGPPSQDYWLNEAQALLICMFSRTDKAADGREQIIKVFIAFRHGELTASKPAHIPEVVLSMPIMERLAIQQEYRRTFGTQRAQQMWRQLALPAPALAATGDEDAWACLAHLLGAEVVGGIGTIRETIEEALDGDTEAQLVALSSGLRVAGAGGPDGFFVANGHRHLLEIFDGTPWEGRTYQYVLKRLPGAQVQAAMKFRETAPRRSTFLPAEILGGPPPVH